MSKVTRQAESTQPTVAMYMALELGAKKWELAFGVGPATPVRRRTIEAGDRGALAHEIAHAKARLGVASDAPVRSCYEAGRDGFWVHRLLETRGVTNVVVDSASIEVNRRARRAKTDRLDATKLLRMLLRHWAGERDLWKVVHVPSVEMEDARHHERAVATLTAERTRWRNRIHALLALHGIRLVIDQQFPAHLATVRDWADAPLPAGVRARVLQAWQLLVATQTALREARRVQRVAVRTATTPATQVAAQLHRLRGVGPGSALTLAKEVFSRDLRNRRQVGGLTGLAAVPYQSGTAARDQGISRAGLRHVRGLAVELAWAWVQWQPDSALTQWYHARFGGGGARARRVGIVALARRLVIALWRYSKTGVVPAGARLRRVAV
jgi:transposase